MRNVINRDEKQETNHALYYSLQKSNNIFNIYLIWLKHCIKYTVLQAVYDAVSFINSGVVI